MQPQTHRFNVVDKFKKVLPSFAVESDAAARVHLAEFHFAGRFAVERRHRKVLLVDDVHHVLAVVRIQMD